MKIKILIFLLGFSAGIVVSTLKYGTTLNAEDQLKNRAVRMKVAEWGLDENRQLKFRFLTEHE
jgi:hypothetical protein